MEKKFVVNIDIKINSSLPKVWDALTNPDMIEKYFFGTQAISDWEVGSKLEFRGVWQDKEYIDKGTILAKVPDKELQYSYLSSFSGLDDKKENYNIITYKLEPKGNETLLSVTQDNIQSEESMKDSEQGWGLVLKGLKELLEKD